MCKIGSPLLSFLLCSLCTPLQKSIKVKCSESFDSGIPVDEEFSVTTNKVESGELPDLNAGDHIRIVFDGIIKESYPLQLGNVFAIYLLDENGNL